MEDKKLGNVQKEQASQNKIEEKQIDILKTETVSNELIEKMLLEKMKREMSRRSFKQFVAYMMPEFTFSKFNSELIDLLQRAYEGKVTRLIVNMPPRHGKTLLINELFPAWVLGNRPEEEFINAGYAVSLAKTSSRRCLAITQTEKFKNVFPNFKLNASKAGEQEWETVNTQNDKKGGYYAVGIGGGLTGRGFTFGIIDDPVKDRQEAESLTLQQRITDWYTSTFLTRKQITKKRPEEIVIIVVMTRWNLNDLTGRIEEMEKIGGDKFEKHIYPAIDEDTNEILFPEKFSLGDYEQQRTNLGVRDFEALYQQNPIKSMGQIFKKENFQYFKRSDFEKAETTLKKEDIVWGIHIDPAVSTSKSSDDCVIMLVGQHKMTKHFYVLDIDGGTISPTESYSKIFAMADYANSQGYKVQYISIEQVTLNRDQTLFKKNFLEQMRMRNVYYSIIDYCPKENKQERILGLLEGRFEGKIIHFLAKDDNNWRIGFKSLEDELLKFPAMKHDDYPDCLAQSIEQLPKRLNSLGISSIISEHIEPQKIAYIDSYTGELKYR